MRKTAPPTAPPATAPVGNGFGFDASVVVADGDCEAVVVAGIKRVAVRDGAV